MRSLLVFLFLFAVPLKLFPAGRLIEVCGIDGSGKSTFVQDISAILSAKGRKVVVLRPVSGDPAIYKLFDELDAIKTNTENTSIHERIDRLKSEYFFFTFLSYKNVIDRLLLDDCDVLCDRYLFSFQTYQECFNQASDQDQELLDALPKTDIIFLLTIPVDIAMSRIQAKGKPAPYENPEFLEKAQQIFLRDASLQQNLVHINGDEERAANTEIALSVLERIK